MEGGVFGIYAVASPGSTPEVMLRMRAICDDLRRNGVTPREFERSREYLKGSFALGLESSSFRMMRLVRSEQCYGRFVTPEEVVAEIDAVSIDEVNDFARRYLDLDRYCVAALGPFRNSRSRLLRAIGEGPWEEDPNPYEKPRARRRARGESGAVDIVVDRASPVEVL
jgi:predicted Zn-dependent peptidase